MAETSAGRPILRYDQPVSVQPIFDRAPIERSVFLQPSHIVAPQLLGAILTSGRLSGRIVETEAYGGNDDPASHAFKGLTARNAVMFGPPGHLYVYFTYGMHFCANVVTGDTGEGQAVLIRAIEPLSGWETMRERRPKARRDLDLTNGPGKVCAALGLDRSADGVDLLDAQSPVHLGAQELRLDETIVCGSRIGISKAVDIPWRFWLDNHRYVSKGR